MGDIPVSAWAWQGSGSAKHLWAMRGILRKEGALCQLISSTLVVSAAHCNLHKTCSEGEIFGDIWLRLEVDLFELFFLWALSSLFFQLPLETVPSAVQAGQPRVKRKGAFCPSMSHKSEPKSVKCEKMRDSIIHMDHSGFIPDCFINSNQRHHFNGFFILKIMIMGNLFWLLVLKRLLILFNSLNLFQI